MDKMASFNIFENYCSQYELSFDTPTNDLYELTDCLQEDNPYYQKTVRICVIRNETLITPYIFKCRNKYPQI